MPHAAMICCYLHLLSTAVLQGLCAGSAPAPCQSSKRALTWKLAYCRMQKGCAVLRGDGLLAEDVLGALHDRAFAHALHGVLPP